MSNLASPSHTFGGRCQSVKSSSSSWLSIVCDIFHSHLLVCNDMLFWVLVTIGGQGESSVEQCLHQPVPIGTGSKPKNTQWEFQFCLILFRQKAPIERVVLCTIEKTRDFMRQNSSFDDWWLKTSDWIIVFHNVWPEPKSEPGVQLCRPTSSGYGGIKFYRLCFRKFSYYSKCSVFWRNFSFSCFYCYFCSPRFR